MTLNTLLAAALLVLATTPTAADNYPSQTYESGVQRVQLLELYTSEGCSSCPPADRWMTQQKQNSDLWQRFVPVAFHVAYWDWIGWADKYANEAYDQRQRNYASTAAVPNVYTPGFVLNGREWRGFFQHHKTLPKSLPTEVGNLQLTIEGKKFTADFDSNLNNSEGQLLHVAILGMGLSSDVSKGENRNKKLQHDFVVVGYGHYSAEQGTWKGMLPMVMHSADNYAIATWVTDANSQQPIQALGGEITLR